MELNVLITGCCAREIEQDVIDLKNNGEREVKVIGVDIKDSTETKYLDGFYQVHKGDSKEFIDDIKRICKEEKIDIIIPTVDTELISLSKHKDDIKAKVLVMDEDKLALSIDKAFMYDKLVKLGFDVPRYAVVFSKEEFSRKCEDFDYRNNKLCLKNPLGFGSRGIRIINEKKDFFKAFMNEKPYTNECTKEMMEMILDGNGFRLILMEFIEGNEYSVNILADNGNVMFAVGKENIDVIDSSPTKSIIKWNDKAMNMSFEIVKKLELDGYIGLDFIIDKEGRPKLLEINPRLTSTVPTINKSGVNYIYLGVKNALNEDIKPLICNVKEITMKRISKEIYFDKNGVEL